MELALAACLGWVITTWLLVNALREKDRHHSLHVSSLLNRIQAPRETVVKELVGDADTTPILPHTEESYWEDIHHIKAGD